jgi:DNA replication ATP-dependent helicase Dna2
MPGTGKTSTVATLIRLLVLMGRSVLVTSHTHSAVDNLLLLLHKNGIDFLRLGSKTCVHPDLWEKCDKIVSQSCDSTDKLSKLYNQVVKSFINAFFMFSQTKNMTYRMLLE